MSKDQPAASEPAKEKPAPMPRCGVVMPISAIDDCDESHWSDVREIIYEAIESAKFTPNLVSNSDDVGVIQKRIVQNLYDNPIVVCDISCKNPNVMFELGLRLAFDKPTIVVKDFETSFSFDTSPIEHVQYPRDLRFGQIVEFKSELAKKIKATHTAATSDPNYTTFLKHFGTFTVAKLDSKEVSGSEMILDEIRELRARVDRRVHIDPMIAHDISGPGGDSQFQRFATEFPTIIKHAAKELGLTRKAEIKKSKTKIRKQAEPDLGHRFCDNRIQYNEWFGTLFDIMYS